MRIIHIIFRKLAQHDLLSLTVAPNKFTRIQKCAIPILFIYFFYVLKIFFIRCHCNAFDHNFDLSNATFIKRESNLLWRKCIESSLIVKLSTVNLRSVSCNISSFLLSQCGILRKKNNKYKKQVRRGAE